MAECQKPKPLFFGSDDEDGLQQVVDPPLEPAAGNLKRRLFFASSDEEDDQPPTCTEDIMKRCANAEAESSPKDMAASSTSSIQSISPPPPKKRYSTPPVVKKRKVTNETPRPLSPMSKVAGFESIYLGTFLVPNAWSTCKGKGWIKAGEEIHIRRNDMEKASSRGSGTSSTSMAKIEKKAQGRQLKLTSMLKSKDKAPITQKMVKKPKVDNVVRFTNSRGFEIGRLPRDVASWVSKLLDRAFRGSSVVDCPDNLQTGAEILLQLRVFLLAEAFRPHRPTTSSEDARSLFNEGQETLDETSLRERKSSLLQLFKVISLKPRRPTASSGSLARDIDVSGGDDLKDENPSDAKGMKGAADMTLKEFNEPDDEDDELLSEGQLNMIYKKAQKHDSMMPEMDPADTFTLTLRPYQKQALLWMYSLESGNHAAREANSMHPLWEEYAFPYEELQGGIFDLTNEQKLFYVNPYSGELSLIFPRAENKCRGGILADGGFHDLTTLFYLLCLGMGKTIMISSLLHTSRDPEPQEPPPIKPEFEERSICTKPRQLKLNTSFRPVKEINAALDVPSATLIVTPTSLMDQWFKELERSSRKGSLKILVWHGNNRDDLDDILEGRGKTDVVITSYGVVGSEWTKHEASTNGSPLFQVKWLRVVLDEAHNCKSRLSRSAKACCALKAKRRWALTGTPIVNKLEDLYSLLKFINFTPWSDYSFFRSFITLPFLNRDPKAVEIVQVIMESVLLRREKSTRDRDGNRIVELPAKEITIERLEFSPMERKVYDSIYLNAKKDFERLNAKGLVGKNYTHILAMLLRLRRAVLHPSLVQVKDTADVEKSRDNLDIVPLISDSMDGEEHSANGLSSTFAQRVLSLLREAGEQECAICLDLIDSPVLVPTCLHACCKNCILGFLQSCEEKGDEGRCPICRRGPLKDSQLLEVVRRKFESIGGPSSPERERDSSSEMILRKNNFNSSTKLTALSESLCRLRDQDPCFRAVVFSQFTSFLDLIEILLKRDGFIFYRFDGEMNVKKKAVAVQEFTRSSRTGKVFIVSLKAGGVGLNLTAADHVYMMDCWWNAAIENQAIDRVHRIGQERTVFVKQFIISNTIEDRILQIQKRKTSIVKAALGGKGDGESLENLRIIFDDGI